MRRTARASRSLPARQRPPSEPFVFDYSLAFSRWTPTTSGRNNEYRNTAVLANVGFAAARAARSSRSAAARRASGCSCSTRTPTPRARTRSSIPALFDNLLTERQLYAPNIDWQATSWWHHRLVLEYDKERQVNNPNDDGFIGPTRATFHRYQLDYQNDIAFTRWLTLTSGVFYENVLVNQDRPFVSQTFGPQARYLKDFTENEAVFAQLSLTPIKNLLFVAGGRYDHFNLFGDVGTLPFRGVVSRRADRHDDALQRGDGVQPARRRRTAFSPAVRRTRSNPEKTFGYDAGFEQALFKDRLRFGANYFHNDLSNVIGFNSVTFATLNLGSARTQGVETFVAVGTGARPATARDLHLPRRGQHVRRAASATSPPARVCRAARATRRSCARLPLAGAVAQPRRRASRQRWSTGART